MRRRRTTPTLRIGIASVEAMKARSMAIARGEVKPASDEPKIWFPSAESLGKVLSNKNRALLARIRDARPQSLQALSELTGREVSNLSRTLKTMELYGLVALKRGPRGTVRPEVPYDEVDVRVPLRAAAE
jgi:predicted transcriptional regulator